MDALQAEVARLRSEFAECRAEVSASEQELDKNRDRAVASLRAISSALSPEQLVDKSIATAEEEVDVLERVSALEEELDVLELIEAPEELVVDDERGDAEHAA